MRSARSMMLFTLVGCSLACRSPGAPATAASGNGGAHPTTPDTTAIAAPDEAPAARPEVAPARSPTAHTAPDPEPSPFADEWSFLCDEEGKRVITHDVDGDGYPDMWKKYEPASAQDTAQPILLCKQIDLNGDGSIDMAVAYDERGVRIVEQFDFDFDGVFDAYRYYDERGILESDVRDTDLDGRYDVIERYDIAGDKVAILRDRNGDGRADMWERLDGGGVVAIEWDDDFDGQVDRRQAPGGAIP